MPLPEPTATPGFTTPSLRRRMACWLYEGVLLFGVVFIADLLFSVLTQTKHGLQNRPEQQAFLFVVLGVYFVWSWIHGHTLPMRTWHIRLLDRQGRVPSPRLALKRYLLVWLWVLPPLAIGALLQWQSWALAGLLLAWVALWAGASQWQAERQFWHDAWAGTRLVHTPPSPPPKRPS